MGLPLCLVCGMPLEVFDGLRFLARAGERPRPQAAGSLSDFAKQIDGRIDDSGADWKGRELWVGPTGTCRTQLGPTLTGR